MEKENPTVLDRVNRIRWKFVLKNAFPFRYSPGQTKELGCLVEVSKFVEFELASSFVPASPKFDTSFKRTEAKVFQTLVRVPTVLSLMIPCP